MEKKIDDMSASSMHPAIRTVTINIDNFDGLGFGVGLSRDSPAFVKSIVKGGAVSVDGRIEVLDQILRVNGTSLEHLTHSQAVDALRAAAARKGSIQLTVAKPLPKSEERQKTERAFKKLEECHPKKSLNDIRQEMMELVKRDKEAKSVMPSDEPKFAIGGFSDEDVTLLPARSEDSFEVLDAKMAEEEESNKNSTREDDEREEMVQANGGKTWNPVVAVEIEDSDVDAEEEEDEESEYSDESDAENDDFCVNMLAGLEDPNKPESAEPKRSTTVLKPEEAQRQLQQLMLAQFKQQREYQQNLLIRQHQQIQQQQQQQLIQQSQQTPQLPGNFMPAMQQSQQQQEYQQNLLRRQQQQFQQLHQQHLPNYMQQIQQQQQLQQQAAQQVAKRDVQLLEQELHRKEQEHAVQQRQEVQHQQEDKHLQAQPLQHQRDVQDHQQMLPNQPNPLMAWQQQHQQMYRQQQQPMAWQQHQHMYQQQVQQHQHVYQQHQIQQQQQYQRLMMQRNIQAQHQQQQHQKQQDELAGGNDWSVWDAQQLKKTAISEPLVVNVMQQRTEENDMVELEEKERKAQEELAARFLEKCQNDWRVEGEQPKQMTRKDEEEDWSTDPWDTESLVERESENTEKPETEENEQQKDENWTAEADSSATRNVEREQFKEAKKAENDKMPAWAVVDEETFQESLLQMQSNRNKALQTIKNLLSQQQKSASLDELKTISEKLINHCYLIRNSTNSTIDLSNSDTMAEERASGVAPQPIVNNQQNNIPWQYQPFNLPLSAYHGPDMPYLMSPQHAFGPNTYQTLEGFSMFPGHFLNPSLAQFAGSWKLAAETLANTDDIIAEKRIIVGPDSNSVTISSFGKRITAGTRYSELERWLNAHKENPFPTKGDKIMLAMATKMTLDEISKWFSTAIPRLRKDSTAFASKEELAQLDSTSWNIDQTRPRDSFKLGGIVFSSQGGFVRCEMAVKEEKLLIRRFDEKKKTVVIDTYNRA